MMCKKIINIVNGFQIFISGLALIILFLLIVFNVITRSLGSPFYWVDELAVYMMIWMVFLALPVLVSTRKNLSVSILSDFVSEKVRANLRLFSSVVTALVLIIMVFYSYKWYSFHLLLSVGMDIEEFSFQTFNYIYQEPTNTLPFNKYWVWLVVLYSMVISLFSVLINIFVDVHSLKRGDS
jgi:TRAP-type C4-dicarboxylate transport system permease small subunit